MRFDIGEKASDDLDDGSMDMETDESDEKEFIEVSEESDSEE